MGTAVRRWSAVSMSDSASVLEAERRSTDLIAAAAAPILAACGVADPEKYAKEIDRQLIRLGYVLTYVAGPAARPVDTHALEHWPALAINLTVYAATHSGREWASCVRDGQQLLAALAVSGITLTVVRPGASRGDLPSTSRRSVTGTSGPPSRETSHQRSRVEGLNLRRGQAEAEPEAKL